jgi:M6 family metalloprotease-like protein
MVAIWTIALLAGVLPGVVASAKPKVIRNKPVRGLGADLAPASPLTIVVKQPNGKAIRARLNGAEIGGHLETVDGGYTIVKGANGWWYYGAHADGAKVTPSKRRAGIDSPKGLARGLGRVPSIWSGKYGVWRDQMFRALQVANYKAQVQAAATGQLPRVFKVPFLLIATWYDRAAGQTEPQFQPGHDAAFFTKLLDGYGGNPTGTMTEFWLENSYGQLAVDVDVYGPFTSLRSIPDPCYYGNVNVESQSEHPNPLNTGSLPVGIDDDATNQQDDDTLNPAGQTVPRVDDLDPAGNFLGIGGLGAVGMAIEAVPQADASVDFAQYDNDNDGYVDFTGLIHSGADMAATGNPCETWSHMNTVSFVSDIAGSPYKLGVPTTDFNAAGQPVLVDRVLTIPEINLDIGVAVHEMMHALGEPDYYNTSYTSAGTGDWDIMAGGSWFGNPPGSNPIGANPATKVFQGWVTPKVVHGDLRQVSLKPRELLPKPGYNGAMVNPNLLLVPIAWTDSTAEADVYGLAKDPANGKYITEGWYIENISRSVTAKAQLPNFKHAPYFERLALSSGIMIWHFDYYKKSNVFFASNDAQSDPNRPQMDPEEFDFNDNTQEIQLNLTRGEPSDLWFGASTGMTSATRREEPLPKITGKPDAPMTGSGITPPGGTAQYPFTVGANPADYFMKAEVVGRGDCKLALFYKENNQWQLAGSVDGGFVGDAEQLTITQPPPGEWRLDVGDFAACLDHEWKVSFASPETSFSTKGAADTWTNQRMNGDAVVAGTPTGWAFTNIGPHAVDGWEHSADAGGTPAITLDILNLDKTEIDVSPGFITTPEGTSNGHLPINVGKATTLQLPVYNNGGKATQNVTVSLTAADGTVIGSATIPSIKGYSRAVASFSWTPTKEGPQDVTARVDEANTVGEEHEGNNVQATNLLVGPANPKVLVVDDDGEFDAEDSYLGALTALGIPWAVADRHADTSLMKQFAAVIWEAGLERYQGQLNRADRDAIRAYLNGGGRLWYTSPRAAAALGEPAGGTNPGGGTFEMVGLFRDYFGATYVDTLQVGGGTFKGVGDVIGGKATIATDVFPGRPLQDTFDVTESNAGKATKVLDWEKGPAGGIKVQGDSKHKSFRTVYFGFNLSQVVNAADQVALTKSVLGWLGVQPGSYTPSTPVIYHTQVRTRIAKQASHLNVYAFGITGAVKAFYKPHDQSLWADLTLKPASTNGVYSGTISGVFSTLRGLDYFVQAGTSADPFDAPNVSHYVGVAPPEIQPPRVLGVKISRASRGSTGGNRGRNAQLPATGVGSGVAGLIPLALALGSALALRRRHG